MSHPSASNLLTTPEADQERGGYVHTLREIRQQPFTVLDTCERMLARAYDLKQCLEIVRAVVFTGSGSSEYVGSCVQSAIQAELGIVTQTIGSGTLLTRGGRALPPLRPLLLVSLARSGDSPESGAVVQLLLETEPEIRHLAVTCNAIGKLVTRHESDPRVSIIALDDRTNDRSLVMTSSFTGLAIAARSLGFLADPESYRALCGRLSRILGHVINNHFDRLESAIQWNFTRAVFLGSGSNFAAAREAGLKMLEMTAGRVATLSESYLALRHGPMSFLNRESLAVCFLSSEPVTRLYEADLIRELDRKKLSRIKVIIGEDIPRDLLNAKDVAIECPRLGAMGEDACLVHVVVGQLLAFFRCLKEGLRPDSPSESGVINRVVGGFRLHTDGKGP
ncbi:MAG: hypothetical protein JOY62_10260 [Acidobacteriaceae bacterium]|nr:hypothetical protein [Acidobacteriaceae bacterium]MBV9780342.1 hypothetical protein [Acidobacteriaceae bacterium]